MSNEVLQFFAYDHLPTHLKEVSKLFHTLATRTTPDELPEAIYATTRLLDTGKLPTNREATKCVTKLVAAREKAEACLKESSSFAAGQLRVACLDLLLEAKDCAVRAVLFKRAGA